MQSEIQRTETPIEKAQRVSREMKEAGIKPEFNPIKRLVKNPTSKKEAFKSLCFSCQGGDSQYMADSTWREDVRNCSAWPPCPAHDFRPYKKKDGEETFAERISRWEASQKVQSTAKNANQ